MSPTPNTNSNPNSPPPKLRPRITVDRDNAPPLTPEEVVRCYESFYFFCVRILPYSFESGFIDGAFIEEMADFMGRYRKTARISSKDHFKSTSFKAHFLWRLFTLSGMTIEDHYFSYEEGMASYHTAKIKDMVKANPYFNGEVGRGVRDLKKAADSVIAYTWDGIHTHKLTPHGLLSFKRGIHTGPFGCVYVDDPLKDPENKLVLTKIKTINDIIESQIFDMPDPQTGEVHVVGTPQTKEDFFFNPKVMMRFAVVILPAMVNRAKREALWPEYMTFDELEAREKERPKFFPQEYLCAPGYAKDSYIDEKKLTARTNPALVNVPIFGTINPEEPFLAQETIAGFDIGKKAHPSHLSVLTKAPILNDKGIPTGQFKLVQIHSKWMDGWDYTSGIVTPDPEANFQIDTPTQVEYLKLAIHKLRIDRVYYDATRGEWEGFMEQGVISPGIFIPVMFNTKTKAKMAETLDKRIGDGSIEFIADQRQSDQMLGVLNDLQAVEGPKGHGDSFWSNGMAVVGFEEGSTTTAYESKPSGW